jgi:hypothetical protein
MRRRRSGWGWPASLPALGSFDVGLTGLALGIKRVEGKIKIVLRGEIHRLPGLYSVGPPLPRVLCITSRP